MGLAPSHPWPPDYARHMARYFDIHPDNPQPRSLAAIADIVRANGVIAYPTDSCYALGCQLGSADGIARIRSIRQLDDRHHLTLMCRDFAQLGQFAQVPNRIFRAIKAATPGSYTFILPATKEVPRRLQHPGKKTVGVRIPRHVVAQALLAALGEPLVSSPLLPLAKAVDAALDRLTDILQKEDRERLKSFTSSELYPVIDQYGAKLNELS